MQIFKYPHISIPIFVIFFLLVGGVAIYFAIRSLKTENEEEKSTFTSLKKLNQWFVRSGKLRDNRCVMFITFDMNNYRNLYSHAEADGVYSLIKRVLSQTFLTLKNGAIAEYGEHTYIAYLSLDRESTRSIVDEFNSALNKCLVDKNALNLIDVRIGAAFVPGSDVLFDEAINRAKQACILAKNQKIPYVEWDLSSGMALEKKIKIENNIENEIDNNRFFLVYQPVLDAKTKAIIGAEALSRLNSAGEGILNPGSFLSAVDSVGLNNKFDYYIFEKNCKWISNDKPQREGYKYTINFSRETTSDPDFPNKILSIANKYGLNSSCLAVEILEDKNITEDEKKQMIENLSALKDKGISILLDDFGSGYATFDDLQNLDISIVKIDRAITQNAVTENGYIILENIIRTAKDIGFKTLCEGVETQEQEDAAIRAGCDLLQGFFYYEPMPALQLEKLFEQEEAEALAKAQAAASLEAEAANGSETETTQE
jgi:EAL domain-containing protein (putative c-di-GMP-specific phosphodiesterase class I)